MRKYALMISAVLLLILSGCGGSPDYDIGTSTINGTVEFQTAPATADVNNSKMQVLLYAPGSTGHGRYLNLDSSKKGITVTDDTTGSFSVFNIPALESDQDDYFVEVSSDKYYGNKIKVDTLPEGFTYDCGTLYLYRKKKITVTIYDHNDTYQDRPLEDFSIGTSNSRVINDYPFGVGTGSRSYKFGPSEDHPSMDDYDLMLNFTESGLSTWGIDFFGRILDPGVPVQVKFVDLGAFNPAAIPDSVPINPGDFDTGSQTLALLDGHHYALEIPRQTSTPGDYDYAYAVIFVESIENL
ncbi:MAG: hypothetical protein ACM3WV_06665 [Bacillota bacterium]